jgi:hypothetical protein
MYTPFEYWNQTKIPYKAQDEKERVVLYKWLQFFYETHHLIPILVDIFSRFPLVGMELKHKDKGLVDFYEQAFFDTLDYPEFFVKLGRMYWTLGNAFALGHFNKALGIWEEEELLDPSVVKVRKVPIIGGEEFYLTSDHLSGLKDIVKKQQPKELYTLLQREYPKFIPFLLKDEDIPVGEVPLRHLAFKTNDSHAYGTPMLLRALRTLMNEEKLMASQDAIAERLYSPFILVKLGIQDMGPNRPPWIPMPEETSFVRDQFDIALSHDFRLMVHHFGIEVQNVFGREQMPRLGDDFDRIERRLMQAFGVNPSLLTGGAATQPYASSALQAEFLSQILVTYQRYLKEHYKDRAKIVAEANGHFEYEKRGDQRVPIEETIVDGYDDDGKPVIKKVKKLAVPEMRMRTFDLRDEATQRQFQQALKQQGVPIPDSELAMGMNFNFEEYLARTEEEMIQKTVATQEAKVKTYDILTAKGLPVPPDLQGEIQGMAGFQPPSGGTELSVDVPSAGGIVMPPPPEGGAPPIGPRDPNRGMRPEESDERNPIRPPSQQPAGGPQIPGVPGQPGQLGVPGAPSPAITPPPGR